VGAFIEHRGVSRAPLIAVLLLGGCATVPPRAADAPQIAITIDDLPVHGPIPPGMTALDVNRQMIRAIKAAGVEGVTVFINGHWTTREPDTSAALQAWQDAGIAVGNHTWSHKDLDILSVAAFEEEISRNEPVVARYSGGTEWRWLRYPYLHEGEDSAKRAEIRTYLANRGYRIASVSMDFGDWKFTAPYARCKAANNKAAIARLETLYLAALRENISLSRTLARLVYGREIPQVLLMHVGGFSAHMMPRVIAEYGKAGFRFVSLAEAQADPAYAEDNDPRLPARPQYLAARAVAKGIAVPQIADPITELKAICPGGPTASAP
jgi:peptidoglycan/xylan/chitin deacetylase (PgdA/CDA1 family)